MTGKIIDAGSSGEWGWHAVETALRCPQLFAYKFRLNVLQKTKSAPLLRGSLMHAALAQHYARMQSQQEGRDPGEWALPYDAVVETAKKIGGEAYVEEIHLLYRKYAAHYASERVEPMAIEEVFRADIAGQPFTQRLDLVVREPNGKVYIWDHKTVGRIDAKIPLRYTLSGQFLGMQNFGAAVYGSEFGGVKLNLVSLSGEMSRQVVDPAPVARQKFTLSVAHARRVIDSLSDTDPWDWPKALSEQTCVTAYGTCEAYEICRWGESAVITATVEE
jgi:hypothetical protein